MPRLDTPEEIGQHMQTALLGEDHWVFVGDEHYAGGLMRLAAQAWLAGAQPQDVHWTTLHTLSRKTGEMLPLGVLTLPRALFSREWVAAAVDVAGLLFQEKFEHHIFIMAAPEHTGAVESTLDELAGGSPVWRSSQSGGSPN